MYVYIYTDFCPECYLYCGGSPARQSAPRPCPACWPAPAGAHRPASGVRVEDGKVNSSHHHKRRIEYFPSLTLGNPRPGVLQQLVQRPPGVPYPLAVLAVHHEHEAAGPGRVVVPQHADPGLAANVPHLTEAALLNRHFNRMHGKQNHLIRCDHFFRTSDLYICLPTTLDRMLLQKKVQPPSYFSPSSSTASTLKPTVCKVAKLA